MLQTSEAGDWALAYNPTNGLLESVAHLDGGAGVQYAFHIMDRVTDITWQADGSNSLHGFSMGYDDADMITNVVYASGRLQIILLSEVALLSVTS